MDRSKTNTCATGSKIGLNERGSRGDLNERPTADIYALLMTEREIVAQESNFGEMNNYL